MLVRHSDNSGEIPFAFTDQPLKREIDRLQ
jgi:hypothetical protein